MTALERRQIFPMAKTTAANLLNFALNVSLKKLTVTAASLLNYTECFSQKTDSHAGDIYQAK